MSIPDVRMWKTPHEKDLRLAPHRECCGPVRRRPSGRTRCSRWSIGARRKSILINQVPVFVDEGGIARIVLRIGGSGATILESSAPAPRLSVACFTDVASYGTATQPAWGLE